MGDGSGNVRFLAPHCKLGENLSIRYVLEPLFNSSKVATSERPKQVPRNPCRVLLTEMVNTSREFYTSAYPSTWVRWGFPDSIP